MSKVSYKGTQLIGNTVASARLVSSRLVSAYCSRLVSSLAGLKTCMSNVFKKLCIVEKKSYSESLRASIREHC